MPKVNYIDLNGHKVRVTEDMEFYLRYHKIDEYGNRVGQWNTYSYVKGRFDKLKADINNKVEWADIVYCQTDDDIEKYNLPDEQVIVDTFDTTFHNVFGQYIIKERK